MGHHHDFRGRFAEPDDNNDTERVRRQHGGRRGGPGGPRGAGPWGEFADWGRAAGGRGRPGPPPWLAGIFGMGQAPEERRGPRVRRGDVRSAILDVLGTAESAGEPINGYQVIQEIADRSGGAWRPSPGSVYPTVQQLQDEGLVESDDTRGRRTLGLTDDGRAYVADHAAELASVWAPFEQAQRREDRAGGIGDVKAEIGQVMSAVWQIVTSGSEAQQRAAIGVLTDTRRRLYGILAEGDEGLADDAETDSPADELGDVQGTDPAGGPSTNA